MAYEKDQKILAEVSEAVDSIKRDAGLSSNTSIRADLLNEDPKSFSTDSMSYVGIAAGIMEENEELFALSRLCDRFAPQYLKICKTLEKTVEYLGSVCVTKSAMKYYQQDVSAIDQLTVHRLHQMISFNFRKVKAVLDQKKEKLHEFDLDLYNQMMSFAKVMERLCATEYRATAIDLGLEEPKKLVKKTVTFSEKKSDSVSPLRELPSYPIDYDVIEKAGARSKEQGTSDQDLEARDKWQGAGGQDSGARGQNSGAGGQEPGTSGQETAPIMDEEHAACYDVETKTEDSVQMSEGSGQEPELIAETVEDEVIAGSISEEDSEPILEITEEELLQKLSRYTEEEQKCIINLIANPNDFNIYMACLNDENFRKVYPERAALIQTALDFIHSE